MSEKVTLYSKIQLYFLYIRNSFIAFVKQWNHSRMQWFCIFTCIGSKFKEPVKSWYLCMIYFENFNKLYYMYVWKKPVTLYLVHSKLDRYIFYSHLTKYKRIPIIKSWFLHADKKGQNQNNGASPFKDYLNLNKCTGLAYKTVYN